MCNLMSLQTVIKMLGHPMGAIVVFSDEFDCLYNSFSYLNCHSQMSLFAVINRISATSLMLVISLFFKNANHQRSCVIGLESFCNDEIEFVINDICTQ